jgi:HrpA-like RNA helicase
MQPVAIAVRLDEVKVAIAHGDVAVQAECGSGKSTTLVKAVGECIDNNKNIYIIQPRCLAAHRVAKRVAELVGCEVGEAVGYATGQETKCGVYTKFKFVTPMVFVQMCLFDRDFQEDMGLVVLDEVHERGWVQDLVFAIVRGLQVKDHSLRLLLLSNYISEDFWKSYTTKGEAIHSLDATGVFLHHNEITFATDPIRRKAIPWEVVRSVRWFHCCASGAILVFLKDRATIQEIKACDGDGPL